MPEQLRFLLDTNVLIPLQDSYKVLSDNLTNFVRLTSEGRHQLVYHPANIADFERDLDCDRRTRNLQYIKRFPALKNPAPCPWNDASTRPNDACDNELLYALQCDAVHALVTEDRGIHAKARARGLSGRTYTIQTAEDWLRRLHETRQVTLPKIQDVPLHSLTPELSNAFFNSLRDGYPGFDKWFRDKARENRMAWVYRDDTDMLAAICVYHIQTDQKITDEGESLEGNALKLCTFKVGEIIRGRKIGELFLKASFRYATENFCENVFIHANAERHDYLIRLLEDFGFEKRGTYKNDHVLVKRHPRKAPINSGLQPFDYNRKYFPHYRHDSSIKKFVVPIQPHFHEVLFPDCSHMQSQLFPFGGNAGNAIKLAYLCHAQTKAIQAGDILLFYRTKDEQAITSIGVVEQFDVFSDAARIASVVSRRTVYSLEEIKQMARRPTKVILFRLVEHLPKSVPYDHLLASGIVAGPIQSIQKLSNVEFSKVLQAAGR